jgi:hypothetical protein
MRSTRPISRRLRCEQLESRWPLAVESVNFAGAPAINGLIDVAHANESQDAPLTIDAEIARGPQSSQSPRPKSDLPLELTTTKSALRGSHLPLIGPASALVDAAIGGQDNQIPPIAGAPIAGEPVAGAPAASPSVLSLDLWPNYNTIGVRIAYTQDPLYVGTTVSANLQVLLGGRWTDAHDFVKDVDQNVLVSKVFGLNEGTTYFLRATFARRNAVGGVVEQQTIFGSASTQVTPVSASGAQVWVAPNGHDNQPGTYEHPRKSISAAARILQPGGAIILKDGEYSFDNEQNHHWIEGKSGAPGQYYTLTAEHPGQARIIGYELVNGTWSAYGNGIYWIHAPQLASTWGDGSIGGPNNLVDVATGRLLYPYRSLTTDDVPRYVYALTQHSEAGWYYDFTTRRLYVKLESGAAPTTGQIRASQKSSGVVFSNSSYWIVDGIHFEQFGQSRKTPGADIYASYPSYGLSIYTSQHIVVRNSTFRHAGLVVQDAPPAPSNILVENNAFDVDGIWDVFYREPFQSEAWQRIKSSLLEIYAIQAAGLGRGMVIRNNTFEGYATSVVMTSSRSNYVADVDIHQNTSLHHLDDVYEFDSDINGTDGGNVNTSIFNNTSEGGLTFVSVSAFHRGPVWIINNYAKNSLSQPIKSGQQRPTDTFTNSAGWKLVYHNTFVSDAPLADAAGNAVWAANMGHGNLVAKNNVFVGKSQYVFSEYSPTGAHRAPLLFERNVFHTTYVGQLRWLWEAISYSTEDAMDAAAPLLEMTNNISSVNPFPLGLVGGLDSRLRDQGAIIKGITSISATGQPTPTDIGRMAEWGFRPQGARVPLASLVRMMLESSGGRLPLSALASLVSTNP